MKNKNIKFGVLLFLIFSIGACKKELNVFPTTSEVDGNAIVDEQSAFVVLNGVYYRFADAGEDHNGVPTLLWTDVNEIVPSQLSGNVVNSSGYDQFYLFTYRTNYFEVSLVWNYGYQLVNAANGFIKNATPVKNIPDDVKRQMLAEARFLRAFGNSELLLYYGQYNDPTSKYGIILRNEFVTASNTNLPRSGVDTAYTSILTDLDSAIAGLPALNSKIYYANASAAKLLKARMLINRGSPGDYEQVISLTNDIITNGPFSLEDSVKDIFLTKGFNSNEVILGVQPYPTETYKFRENQYYQQYVIADSLAASLKNDGRSQWYYKTVPVWWGGDDVRELTKYYSGDPIDVGQTPLSENCYAFRLSEAYLLEAEAITLSNGDLSLAKTLLKTVEAHAGVTDFTAIDNAATAADLQVLIVKEEMRNFAFENGADWFALRRLPFATIQQLNPNIKDETRLILPIPLSELSLNNVIQNPGY